MNRDLIPMKKKKVKIGENPHEKMLAPITHQRHGNPNCREMSLKM